MPELMPDYEKHVLELKPKFIERYKKISPNYDEFIRYSFSFLRRAIRVNTLKITIPELKKRMSESWVFEEVPWCKEGFWITHKEGRKDIGNTLEHALGYIYVQEPASMIPPILLEPKENEIILDLCASPGSKCTQIAQYMNNTGLIIGNDYKGARLAALGMNMQRMGLTNALTTLSPGHFFKDLKIFDKILVDAPCSGTGTIRKSVKTVSLWNPAMIKRLSATQKKLICTGFENLKEGGTLVYSTCSLEPEEDEEVVSYLLEKYPNAKIEDINIKINRSAPITEFESKQYNPLVKKCLRLWPADNDTEGFFVCKIRKL